MASHEFNHSRSYEQNREDHSELEQDEFDRHYVCSLLDRHNSDIYLAAKEAGMDHIKLHKLAMKHGLMKSFQRTRFKDSQV